MRSGFREESAKPLRSGKLTSTCVISKEVPSASVAKRKWKRLSFPFVNANLRFPGIIVFVQPPDAVPKTIGARLFTTNLFAYFTLRALGSKHHIRS
jgi:hypothetical protein